jgi:uncharacterized protein with HEPN domain
MNETSRNIEILKKIIAYCDQLDEARDRFGGSLEALEHDRLYKSAVAMCVLQIGELTTHLSNGFKDEFDEVPWRDIKAMRNLAAHHYGEFRSHYLWNTMINDIDPLREYCKECIEALSGVGFRSSPDQ